MINTITYWIQKADLSAQEYGPITIVEAITAFQNHDWNSELTYRKELIKEGKETCDAGIGFVSSDRRILHICPLDNQNAYYHYHFMKQSKFLGIIPTSHQETCSNMKIEIILVREIIENFFLNNHEWLLAQTNTAG